MNRIFTVFAVLLLASAGAAFAAADDEEPISPERPGFTNGTDTVAPGHLQLEWGVVTARQDADRQTEAGDGAQLRVPLSERAEARLGLQSYVWERAGGERQSGLGDLSVSFKYRFVDDARGRHPSAAIIAGVELKTGSAAEREDDYQPSAALELTQQIGDRFSIDADVVYNGIRQNGLRYDEWAGGLCLNYQFTRRVGGFLETYRVSDLGQGKANAQYVDGGVTYLLDRDTQVDFNAGVGANGIKNDYFVGAGVARRW